MNNKILVIGVIIILIVGYFILVKGKTTNLVEVDGLYDSDKNLIKKGLSVIGDIEGVKYVTLKINVNNLDKVPLTLYVKSLTPLEIESSKPSDKINLNPKETKSWVTGLIDIEPYEGKTQEFCTTVVSEKIPALRESKEINGCLSIEIKPNPIADFQVSLESNIGSGDINPGCAESWTCNNWGSCVSGEESRICTDLNNCGTTTNKPSEKQPCNIPNFETNAEGGYASYKSGTWVKIDSNSDGNLEQYNYAGTITTGSCIGTFLIRTPEGYAVNKYQGSSGLSIHICNPSGSGYKRYN